MKAREKKKAVLVVGGGVAGIQASLDLAEMGYHVYLAEESPAIGGTMPMLGRTFPTNDCSMCILSPKLVECGRHPGITVFTCADVLDVQGEPGDFQVRVKLRSRGVDDALCKGCGDCAVECPVHVDDRFNQELNGRRAIYKPYPQAFPNSYTVDRENCINCQTCVETCGAGAVTLEAVDEEVELPVGAVILSPGARLIDPARLESYRYAQLYPGVLTALEFERLISSTGPYQGRLIRPSDEKEIRKMAWIQCAGSRDDSLNRNLCSAVCCMYAIKQAMVVMESSSHPVELTVFYQDMRAYGKGFERYYRRARDMGIRFVRSRPSEIKQAGDGSNDMRVRYLNGNGTVVQEQFDLVVLSLGLQAPPFPLARRLGLALNDLGFCEPGFYSGVETSRGGVFVAGTFAGPRDIPDTVTQASAAAGAAAALLGPASRTGEEVVEERDVRGEEPRIGVFVCRCGGNISRVVDVGRVAKGAGGLPHVIHSTVFSYSCAQDSLAAMEKAIAAYRLNRVVVAACSPRTHRPLFQNLLQRSGLNRYLFEMANIREHCSWAHMAEPERATAKSMDLVRMAVEKAARLEPLTEIEVRVEPAALVVGGGIAGMTCALDLAQQGFPVHLVEKAESLGGNGRRLYYGLKGEDVRDLLEDLVNRVTAHPGITVHRGCRIEEVDGCVGNFHTRLSTGVVVKHGVVVLATGAGENKQEGFLYGRDHRVLTIMELEEKMACGDLPLDRVRNLVFIQCAGTRNDRSPYCSRVCCGTAIRLILRLVNEHPRLNIFVFYRDMMTYGFLEQYYREARDRGVVFIRYDDPDGPVVESMDEQGLVVTATGGVPGTKVSVRADLVALATGIIPGEDNHTLSRLFKVPLNEDGFFLEAHLKLRPVDFSAAGVFVCGMAHGPKNVEESVTQARAAAARAATVLSRKKLRSGAAVARVDPEKCAACLTCVRLCAFSVPKIVDHVAVIEPVLCRGCGVCAGECPNKAIQLLGYRDEFFTGMVKGGLL